jgi:methanesulfonate monooxygenase small subunit
MSESAPASSPPSPSAFRRIAEDVVYAGCLYLDDSQFGRWLELTAPEFRYRIQAYSPELRKEMTWLDRSRSELAALFELLPKHHIDGAKWSRHAVVYSASQATDGSLRAVSSVALFHTAVDIGDVQLESGSSRLFAVGRYEDRLRLESGRWLLSERTVRLDTRQLGVGTHLIP